MSEAEDFDRASALETLMKSRGWTVTVEEIDLRISALVERMVQVDCTDAERTAIAGEIRGLRYSRDWPQEEHTAVIRRVVGRTT